MMQSFLQARAGLLWRGFSLKAAPAGAANPWKKPEKGWIKVNFDGSCRGGSMKASIGVVARDYKAEFLSGFAEPIGRATSSMAELLAAKRGLELALEHNWSKLWVEGDAKIVVDLLSEGKLFGPKEVAEHAKDMLDAILQLDDFKISHVYRKGNRVADRFATIGNGLDKAQTWRETPPVQVQRFILEDAHARKSK